jgi:hypothetical protein
MTKVTAKEIIAQAQQPTSIRTWEEVSEEWVDHPIDNLPGIHKGMDVYDIENEFMKYLTGSDDFDPVQEWGTVKVIEDSDEKLIYHSFDDRNRKTIVEILWK